jgi:hypothetical protein
MKATIVPVVASTSGWSTTWPPDGWQSNPKGVGTDAEAAVLALRRQLWTSGFRPIAVRTAHPDGGAYQWRPAVR